MARTGELWVGAAVIMAAAAMAAASYSANADTRVRKDRELVEAAARQFGYDTINQAWTQIRVGNPAPLEAVKRAVPLPYVGAHERAGSVVVFTFAAHRRTCVDLLSSPIGNTVRTRPGC